MYLRTCVDGLVRAMVCILLSGGLLPLSAQQAVTSATLTGEVEDSSGAAVSGATVAATNLERNQSWKTSTDDQGRYRFRYLPVGSYRLVVEHQGFAKWSKDLTLSLAQTMHVPVRLALTTMAETVIVSSELPVGVEVARTQVAHTILPREVDVLPLNGRNYLDLALLVPGVSRTNTGNNERFAETSAVPGTGISVDGQRNINNGFIVDGLSANDDAADLAGTFYGQEVIREFQVVTSGGIAEFGRASAGTINIVTKSGTNDWRGRLYGFLRNQRLDARNAFAATRDPLTQTQYGATLGGPLRRDRTFLFSNFEQTRLHRAGLVTISPQNALAINSALDRARFQGSRIRTGAFPTGYDSTNYFVRLDRKLGDGHQLAARYSLYDISSQNARNVGGLNAVSRGTGLDNRDQTLAVNEVATLSAASLNEFRAQYTRSRLAAPVNDPVGPAINISGIASLGTATFSPTARNMDLYQLADNFSVLHGSQSLKTGIDFLYNRLNITFPGAVQGVYTFSSLGNLQAGRYVTFQQAFGTPAQFQSSPNLGVYIQDEWRPRKKLTVNVGLRYDAQRLPEPIQTDSNNFAPRIGIAYSPGDHRTVIRASFGLYYDRIPLRAVSNALQRRGTRYKLAVLAFGQDSAPIFPNVLPAFPAGLLTSITTMDPRIRNAHSHQSSLQVERDLGGGISFSAAYTHLRGLHLIMSRNINVPALSASEAARLGVPNLGRPDPQFANVSRFESIGDSYYDGLTLSLNRRAARWGIRASYTLSKAIDTAGNFFFSTPQNSFNIRDERGLSNNDQRHRLSVSGMLEVPVARTVWPRILGGVQLSYIFSYTAALPFNVQTGTDRNNDTNVNDRPEGIGRNTGKGFGFNSLDVRLSRIFRWSEHLHLEAMAEAFNLLNHTNLQFPNNIFGPGSAPPPTFGRATAAADPRQIQLGLRLSF